MRYDDSMKSAIEAARAVWGNEPRKAIRPSFPEPRYWMSPRLSSEWKIMLSVNIAISRQRTITPAGPRVSNITCILGLILMCLDLISVITDLVMFDLIFFGFDSFINLFH